ncbi:MAG: hypothetical protein KGI03_00835 [Patescibacteria group bacterium]|nr:hypothetical protein [Patescibacteria group bacterium]
MSWQSKNEFKVGIFTTGTSAAQMIETWLNELHEGGWAVQLVHFSRPLPTKSTIGDPHTGEQHIFVIAKRWRREQSEDTELHRQLSETLAHDDHEGVID